MSIIVQVEKSKTGLWSWQFAHPIWNMWRGGFMSEFAARAHARECAIAIGRKAQFVKIAY